MGIALSPAGTALAVPYRDGLTAVQFREAVPYREGLDLLRPYDCSARGVEHADTLAPMEPQQTTVLTIGGYPYVVGTRLGAPGEDQDHDQRDQQHQDQDQPRAVAHHREPQTSRDRSTGSGMVSRS